MSSNQCKIIGEKNIISSIKPYNSDDILGAKEFLICFEKNIDSTIFEKESVGIENLTWCPEVIFTENIIRNNRARGALFSTPKDVIVENNFFDHTSGTAILLCGDCNGWFETGACRNVVIRRNHFVNALTNMFQFTDGIISIYPEIPNLQAQTKYFHGGNGTGVVIEDNLFETFDAPIVYAKSLDGLVFRGNKIEQNNDYAPFHWNRHRFLLDKVVNVTIENNDFSTGFDAAYDGVGAVICTFPLFLSIQFRLSEVSLLKCCFTILRGIYRQFHCQRVLITRSTTAHTRFVCGLPMNCASCCRATIAWLPMPLRAR